MEAGGVIGKWVRGADQTLTYTVTNRRPKAQMMKKKTKRLMDHGSYVAVHLDSKAQAPKSPCCCGEN